MSIETWKKEFYTDINKACKSKKSAIEHSLHKWRGLLPKNLSKHKIKKEVHENTIIDKNDAFRIGADSCALCVKYDSFCVTCPLFNYLGTFCDYHDTSPYTYWINTHDPKPMISALTEILKQCEKRNKG